MKLNLTNIKNPGSRIVKRRTHAHIVTKFIGEGSRSAVLEIVDQETHELPALRIRMLPLDSSRTFFNPPESEALAMIARSVQGMLQTCGDASLDVASSEKGIGVIRAIAPSESCPWQKR